MRVIVVGAGTVGSNIAMHLAREQHEVIVLDKKADKLADVEDHADVQTLAGDGCDPSVLRRALGEGEATSLLLAVTESDPMNLVVAYAAKRLGVPRVVARVRHRYHLDPAPVNFRDPLGIDLLLSPEMLSAHELSNFVENPAALAFASLSHGRVQIRTVMLSPFSELCMRPLRELSLPQGVLVGAVRRGKETFIPRGDAALEAGDHVTLIGLPEVIEQVHPKFDTEQETRAVGGQRVAIAGAGETGLYLAELLEERHHKVTVIDQDRRRCELASERLDKATVLHGDCTNVQFLREEQVGHMDYYIAATGDDESNVMSALLARELKVDKTACLIDRPDYVRVVEMVGIDVAISPRIVAANRIMTLVKQGRIKSVTLLEEGAVEVTEYQALSKSPIVGTALKNVELPKGTLIGAIVRGQNVSIPRGDSIIRPGELVITLSEAGASESLNKLFQEGE
ncbi:MAG: trk/ktr system potassium uptake protein [Candidatus Sumerlaeota bacterium]|nr:trk/ktr system potassium uptake protein [Candidatus Sumerlaeota bacterium]